MSGSTISTFRDSDDFLAALKEVGYRQFLLLRPPPFQARMIRISLERLRLFRIEEWVARVAFLMLPPIAIRIVLPGSRGSLLCGGMAVDDRHLLTHGGGAILCERTDGSADSRHIVVPSRLLAEYGRLMTGTPVTVPTGTRRWQPPVRLLKALSTLHAAATGFTARHPGKQSSPEAVHGLEQELIGHLVECLSTAHLEDAGTGVDNGTDIVARFVNEIESCGDRCPTIMEICEKLGVAERALRRYCQLHLALGPAHYARLHRMHLVHRSLQNEPDSLSVAQAARRFGFCQMGRFAGSYRELFGEVPSVTLRRSRTA